MLELPGAALTEIIKAYPQDPDHVKLRKIAVCMREQYKVWRKNSEDAPGRGA